MKTIKIYYIDTRGKLAVNLIRIFNSNYSWATIKFSLDDRNVISDDTNCVASGRPTHSPTG